MNTRIRYPAWRPLGLAAAMAIGAAAAQGATFDVDTTLDAPASPAAVSQGICDDGMGQCTLRAAIQVADAAATASIIRVPAGIYTLTVSGVDESAISSAGTWSLVHAPDPSRGDLNILQRMTIVGAGSDQTVIEWAAGSQQDRVFHIEVPPGATEDLDVTIQGITVKNGYVPAPLILDASVPTAVLRLARMGGGIAIGAGAEIQTIDSTAVEGGEGDEGGCGGGGGSGKGGGGCAGPEGHGGPGESESGATLQRVTLTDVKVLDNHAGGEGGGIYNTAPLVLDQVVVAGNDSGANGGGIYNDAAMHMQDSTIGTAAAPNSAADGGGLFETGFHTTVIERSAFIGNSASSGGAIAGRRMVQQLISRSTIADNTATDGGAAIMTNGRVELVNATVAANTVTAEPGKAGAGLSGFGPASAQPAGGGANAANFSLVNTIVAANAYVGATSAVVNCGGKGEGDPAARFHSMGYNIEDGDSCGLRAAGDQAGVDPMLGPLGDNGGPTPTMAIAPGSPAVDRGESADCPNEDQRGQIGHADGDLNGTFECDVGAFELFVESADLHIDGVSSPDTVYVGDSFQVSATIHIDPAATGSAAGVQVKTTMLPSTLTLASAVITTPAGMQDCLQSAAGVTCDAGTLAPGQTATLSLMLSAAAENANAAIDFLATQATPADPNPANNAAAANVTEAGKADLSVTSWGPDGAVQGAMSYVPFSISNAGPQGATAIRLGIMLPANVAFSSIDLPGASCSYDGTDVPASILCTMAALPAGRTLSGLLTVTDTSAGAGTLTFAADAAELDSHLTDNKSLVALSVASPAISSVGGGGCASRPGGGFDPLLLAMALAGGAGALVRRKCRTRPLPK